MSSLLDLIDGALLEMATKKLADTNHVTDILLDIRSEVLKLPAITYASELLPDDDDEPRVAVRADE